LIIELVLFLENKVKIRLPLPKFSTFFLQKGIPISEKQNMIDIYWYNAVIILPFFKLKI